MTKLKRGFLGISKGNCGRILDALFAMAKVVWEPFQVRPILSDPSDDKILECAISGNCTHIITFNTKHFPKVVTKLYGIQPMSPRKFLKLWRGKS